jgi:hypothetical protein
MTVLDKLYLASQENGEVKFSATSSYRGNINPEVGLAGIEAPTANKFLE